MVKKTKTRLQRHTRWGEETFGPILCSGTFVSASERKWNFVDQCNEWITKGIKVSCRRKRELYVLCRSHNDYALKLYYKKYCSLLTKVIQNAKKLHYNIILRANNKTKTTWKSINRENGTTQHDISVSTLTIDDSKIANQSIIANVFNNYFSSVADLIKIKT